MKEILTARNLTKEYFVKTSKEAVKVIKGINLSITEGEKVGYVGLNGAGKSTTIKMLTGLIKAVRLVYLASILLKKEKTMWRISE